MHRQLPFDPRRPFVWRDGARTIVFGPRSVDRVEEFLGDEYVALTTERAAAMAPALIAGAAAVHHVPAGLVDEVAGDLLGQIGDSELLVALGGGRVIDVTKALAAAHGRRAAAVPTTLSAAEMTLLHRQARGADPATGLKRPDIVINDPTLSASQSPAGLVTSALNALGHVAEAPLTIIANPVATLAALQGGELLVRGLPERGEPDRPALALGALLSGYAIDQAAYGLHHVLTQTLVRYAGAEHGPANAAMLSHSLVSLRTRAPQGLEALDAALGGRSEDVAARLAARAGAARLRRAAARHRRRPERPGALHRQGGRGSAPRDDPAAGRSRGDRRALRARVVSATPRDRAER